MCFAQSYNMECRLPNPYSPAYLGICDCTDCIQTKTFYNFENKSVGIHSCGHVNLVGQEKCHSCSTNIKDLIGNRDRFR